MSVMSEKHCGTQHRTAGSVVGALESQVLLHLLKGHLQRPSGSEHLDDPPRGTLGIGAVEVVGSFADRVVHVDPADQRSQWPAAQIPVPLMLPCCNDSMHKAGKFIKRD
jgi:hypothetical protein